MPAHLCPSNPCPVCDSDWVAFSESLDARIADQTKRLAAIEVDPTKHVSITIKAKLPRGFRLRMAIVKGLLKLACWVAPVKARMEVDE